MNALIVKPKEKPQLIDIQGTLEELQRLVGGTIDIIDPYEDDIILIFNDNGKLFGLPPNRRINDWITIYGTLLICGRDVDGKTVGLSNEQVKQYSEIMQFTSVYR